MASKPDNMRIWQAVEKTDPANTKRVNQRGGFTAIGAHSQIKAATEQFGPIGAGWGYDAGEPMFHDVLVIVPIRLWHGDRSQTFGPVYGAAEWKNGKGYVDSDAAKKATTDGLTKALSLLGFNADVFLGRFDDNKYVAAVAAEFAGEGRGQSDDRAVSPGPNRPPARTALDGPYKSITALEQAHKRFDTAARKVGETAEWEAVKQQAAPLIDQMRRDHPDYWNGWPEQPDGFEPMRRLIERLDADFAAFDAAQQEKEAA